jgi:RNA polymerase sigma-70 factor (ECF subfamily)
MSPNGRDRYTQDPPPEPELPTEPELVDRFWARVCVMAARRLRDPSAAQDVAQETIRRVVDAMRNGRIENPAALPAFVFQTARHICLHSYRSEGREERALARMGAEGDTADDVPNALGALISAEDRLAVRGALARLTEPERALLAMLYFEGLATDVVAATLGVTAGALRVRKHRALAHLAELLGREVTVKRSPLIGNV